MRPNPERASFISYVWADRENRHLLLLGSGLQILLWLIYKWCLPGPDYFIDSISYMTAAIHDYSVFYRPMGYARFLSWLHGFSASFTFVTTVQYLLICWAGTVCFFSMEYLLHFKHRWLKWLSWGLMTLQPLLLVLGNLVSSDCLFTTLTIVWFTLLLWILFRSGWWVLIAQALVVVLAFQVRYNAIYYPLISCLAFVLAIRATFIYRIVGIGVTVLLISASYHSIRTETAEVTGADVFSGFSGWQMANNALYLLPHMRPGEESFEDPDMMLLHRWVLAFADSVAPESRQAVHNGEIGSVFLWDNHSPLKQYLFNYCQVSRQPYLQSWYQVSPLYETYGKTLILRHPWVFLRRFIWPNTRAFMIPPGEYLSKYHYIPVNVPKEVAEWAGWDTARMERPEPQPRMESLQGSLIALYPALHAWVGLLCLLAPIGWWACKRRGGQGLKLLLLWYVLVLSNFIFSITAAPVVLRYEACWFVLGTGIPFWFISESLALRNKRVYA